MCCTLAACRLQEPNHSFDLSQWQPDWHQRYFREDHWCGRPAPAAPGLCAAVAHAAWMRAQCYPGRPHPSWLTWHAHGGRHWLQEAAVVSRSAGTRPSNPTTCKAAWAPSWCTRPLCLVRVGRKQCTRSWRDPERPAAVPSPALMRSCLDTFFPRVQPQSASLCTPVRWCSRRHQCRVPGLRLALLRLLVHVSVRCT